MQRVDQRPSKTPKARQREEGIRICVEIIQQVREIQGVHGVHLMAHREEEAVAEIIERAGLLPGDNFRAGICAPGEL